MLEGQTFTPAAPRPPIALLRALPAGPLARKYQRLKELADLFVTFDRDDMEMGVDLLLAEMDARDGDPDVELNGDELDCTDAEDEESNYTIGNGWLFGPGCPIAECGTDHFGAGDPSWIEWQTRGRHKLDRYGAELVGTDRRGNMLGEDEEDDDPAEEDGEDRCAGADDDMRDITVARMGGPLDTMIGDEDAEYAGDEKDGNGSEDDFMTHASDGGPGCPISDPGGTEVDPNG